MCHKTSTTLVIVFGMVMTAVSLLAIYQNGMIGVACVGGLLSTCILITVMIRSYPSRRSSSSDAERQQQQQQQASEDGLEDQDSPPSYEVVTAKPPPYHLIYGTNSPSTDGVAADDVVVIPSPDAVIGHTPISLGPQDLDHKENVWQRNACTPAEPETSPPSFSQAIRSSLGWTTPETGAIPLTPLSSGTALHVPPDSGSTPISPPDSGSTPISPLESGSTPISSTRQWEYTH